MTTLTSPVRIRGHHTVSKHLGRWTAERDFQVRAHRGLVVLDLRSPEIPAGDIRVDVDLDHAVLKLLVAADAVIEDWDLRRTGRGRIKDAEGAHLHGVDPGPARRVVLTGQLAGAEIRIHRGGIAQLSAMFSRAYLDDLLRAHREGGYPTVDDPTRTR
jgi:hypothetical protein